jgi:hypothetical protein
VDFDVITSDQIVCICHIQEKNGSIVGQCISYLYISRSPMTLSGEKYCTVYLLH